MLPVPIDELRCPATGQPLVKIGECLRTETGDLEYQIANGVPVLIAGSGSVFSVDEIQDHGFVANPSFFHRLKSVKPRQPAPREQRIRFEHFVQALVSSSALGTPPKVLVVGGGTLGRGAEPLIESGRITLVETDVFINQRTAIVCDGHSLPFVDGAFDGVVIQAVLEHVLDPPQVVAEIHRVLRSGGLVYAETPFMQQVHEGPYDFTRWTETGHRRLFRMFDELDRGVVGGPGTALAWAIRYFARSFFRSQSLILAADRVAAFAFFWLPYLDRVLTGSPAAGDGASGVFFLGSKRVHPVADQDVLASYRGAVGRPVRRLGD